MPLSDYAQDKVLDHLLGVASWTAPTGVWVQLHVGSPSTDGTTNVASNSTRVQAPWAAAVAGASASSGNVVWTSSEAADERLSHVSLWDAVTGGNCLFVSGLSSSVTTAAGVGFSFPASNLILSSI